MTLAEFRAWLDGFCENLPAGGAPTPEQFAKIKQRLASVTGDTFVMPAPEPSLPQNWPWPNPLQPFVVGGRTGDPLPDHGVVVCGIDWSSDHLSDIRQQGRAEALH